SDWHVAQPDLDSFPTRRSSDLRGRQAHRRGGGSGQAQRGVGMNAAGWLRRARPLLGTLVEIGVARGTGDAVTAGFDAIAAVQARSEEHTSELQSLAYLVCRLLL